MRNQEIAGKLHLREHTVRNYLFRIFEKLGQWSEHVDYLCWVGSWSSMFGGVGQAKLSVREVLAANCNSTGCFGRALIDSGGLAALQFSVRC